MSKHCRPVSHELSVQLPQKMSRSGITLWKLDLNKEKAFESLVLFRSGFRVINNMIQTP